MMNRRKFKVVGISFVIVFLLLVLFLGINAVEKYIDMQEMEDVYEEDTVLSDVELLINGNVCRYNAAVRNYLVIGTDVSGTYKDKEAVDYHGNMADVLLLVVLNRSDNNYAVLEIDRNTIMKVPMMNPDGSVNARSLMQICTAHWFGGNPQMSSENTVNAVSELLGGIPIDGYYELNMDSIEKLNNVIGGVTVTVEGDFSQVDPTLIEGEEITLNDKQAYNYIHARMEVGDGTNEGRMARQEAYIKAYLNKLMEKTEEDPKFPNEIYQKLKEVAQTNMTGNDFSRVLNRANRGENLGTLKFEGRYEIGKLLADGLEHQEFYINEGSYYQVMDKLFHLTPVKE
ncbi:LCP family protein [Butyrivibrio sp. LC3010]|uniref:LCP family protein n=1 Tax=Butyrivibrio sp. LC3010 TaxID=1280680 RepID=UPI0009DB9782|nr:LCP family protein [Butyrivibrio sp. LC3010]